MKSKSKFLAQNFNPSLPTFVVLMNELFIYGRSMSKVFIWRDPDEKRESKIVCEIEICLILTFSNARKLTRKKKCNKLIYAKGKNEWAICLGFDLYNMRNTSYLLAKGILLIAMSIALR